MWLHRSRQQRATLLLADTVVQVTLLRVLPECEIGCTEGAALWSTPQPGTSVSAVQAAQSQLSTRLLIMLIGHALQRAMQSGNTTDRQTDKQTDGDFISSATQQDKQHIMS